MRVAWPMKPRKIRRPPGFFRAIERGGRWPDEVTLELHRPPGHPDLSDEKLTSLVHAETALQEAAARKALEAAQRHFLGRRGVRLQSRYSYPSSSERRFGLRPSVAARSKWARIERLYLNHDWLERYQAARDRVRTHGNTVVFPYGTWKMRVYYRFSCAPPDDQHRAA